MVFLNRCDARAAVVSMHKRREAGGAGGGHDHSIRHSEAVVLLKSRVDPRIISHIPWHASPTTTNRYAKVDLE